MTNPVIKNMMSRRSIRAYKPQQVADAEMDAVLKAGSWAASGMNLQGWKIVCLQSADMLNAFNEALRQTCLHMPTDENTPPFMLSMKEKAAQPGARLLFDCPAYIIVTYDQDQGNAMADSSLAMGNMMLAANAVGLGTCWHNMPVRVGGFPPVLEFLKKIGLPENHRIYGTLAIGYPDETPAPSERKEGVIVKL